MENVVNINPEGYIEVCYCGDQSYQTVQKVTGEVLEYANQLREENKPVYILNSISGLGKADSGSRKAALEALNLSVYDKVALYGGNLFFKTVANLIIMVSKYKNKIRYFNTKTDATEWLCTKKPIHEYA